MDSEKEKKDPAPVNKVTRNGLTGGPYVALSPEICGPQGTYTDFLSEIYSLYGPYMDFLPEIYSLYGPNTDFLAGIYSPVHIWMF